MAIQNLELFTRQTYTAFSEVLMDNVNLFNERTNGTIVLATGEMMRGGWSEEAFYKHIEGLLKRRDPISKAPIPQVAMQMAKTNKIRLAWRTDELELPFYIYDWIDRDVREASVTFGLQLAQQIFAEYLKRALGATAAAMLGNAANVVYDATTAANATTNTMTPRNLVRGQAKFGDASDSIQAWIMPTVLSTDYLLDNMTNANALFSFGNVTIQQDIQGRPIISTDAAGFTTGTGVDEKFMAFGLTDAAVVMREEPDYRANTEEKNGHENILVTYQAQWSSDLQVKGYKFTTAGLGEGESPSDAAIMSSANWTQATTSHKATAGVLVLTK